MWWRGSLKGLSHESGWSKSAESLGASHLERDLSIDTISSQIYLAGQSLQVVAMQLVCPHQKHWYTEVYRIFGF
jgi:hypothetical protein